MKQRTAERAITKGKINQYEISGTEGLGLMLEFDDVMLGFGEFDGFEVGIELSVAKLVGEAGDDVVVIVGVSPEFVVCPEVTGGVAVC